MANQEVAPGEDVLAFQQTPGTHTFEIGNGGETFSSVKGTTDSSEFLMFSNFTASKFVAKATITYPAVPVDQYPRIGFVMVDESGNYGGLATYGHADNAVASLVGGKCRWYYDTTGVGGHFRAVEYGDAGYLGKGDAMAGLTMDLILVYNEGNAQFFVQEPKFYGLGYRLFWDNQVPTLGTLSSGWTGKDADSGKVLEWGKKLEGNVAVGLIETENTTSSYIWSNVSIEDGQDAIDAFYAQKTVVLSEKSAEVAELEVYGNTNYTAVRSWTTVKVIPKTEDIIFTDIKINGKSPAANTYNINYSTGAWAIELHRVLEDTVIEVVTAPRPENYNVRPDDKKGELIAVKDDNGKIVSYKHDTYNWPTQESPMRNDDGTEVTFTPSKQILTYQYTYKGLNVRTAPYNNLTGMFVRSQDGGIARVAAAGAGDEFWIMAHDDFWSRRGVQPTGPWVPLGSATGYYCYDNMSDGGMVDIRVVVDGYDWYVWARARNADGTHRLAKGWGLVYARNGNLAGSKSINMYEAYNLGATPDSRNQRTSVYHQNTLYNLDEPCTFGISSRRDTPGGNDHTKNATQFTDLYWTVTDRDGNDLVYTNFDGEVVN